MLATVHPEGRQLEQEVRGRRSGDWTADYYQSQRLRMVVRL